MLNEVKHLAREEEAGIAPEGMYDGHPGAPGFASAQDDEDHMPGDGARLSQQSAGPKLTSRRFGVLI